VVLRAKVINSKNTCLLPVEDHAVSEMEKRDAKNHSGENRKELRQKNCMQERAVCSNICWKRCTQQERNKEAAEDGTKDKFLRG